VSSEWKWLDPPVVLAIHKGQIARHGGLAGVRDQGLIDSALARPRNLAGYGDPDAAELAASYVLGIARNDGFIDGNKRTAWVAGRIFLAENGLKIRFEQADGYRFMLAVADGTMDETATAAWFRSRLVD